MTRYEKRYDTDWDSLDRDEAAERAYAIGVAEKLGEDNRDHLERIYAEMGTVYEKSIVELAFEEGRREVTAAADDHDSVEEIWSALVEGETTDVGPDPDAIGGREGLPESLAQTDVIEAIDIDSTDAVDRPDFLER